MRKSVKIALWVVGGILIAAVVALISVDIWASGVANKAIQKSIAKVEGSETVMRVGSIQVGLLSGMVNVQDIYLASDTGTFDTSEPRKQPGMEVYVPNVTFELINYYKLFRYRQLDLHGITVFEPHIVVWLDEKNPEACVPVFPKDTTFDIAKALAGIDLGRVRVQRASGELKSVRTSLHAKADSLSVKVRDLQFTTADMQFAYNDSSYEFSVDKIYLLLPDGSKDLSVSNLRTEDSGPVMLGTTRVRDLFSNTKMAKKAKEPITWIDLTVSELRTSPINPIRKALAKDFTLDSVFVDVHRMHVVSDQRFAPKRPVQTPQKVLMQIPAVFEVGNVHAFVHTINIGLTLNGEQYAKLQLKDITADLKQVTNRKNATWTNYVSAPMGEGRIEASFAMHMNRESEFDTELYGENFDLGVLNPFIRPITGLTFDSHVDRLEACYKGNGSVADGEFLMMYHGLDVAFHKDDQVSVDIIKKYGKTIEGFANNLVPKSNPTAVDPEPRRYKVQWKRDEWKQYPLFIFGPCIMGVVETMLPGLYAHKQIRSTDVKPKTSTATKSTTTSADTKSSAKTTDTKTTTQTDKSTKTKKQTKKAK